MVALFSMEYAKYPLLFHIPVEWSLTWFSFPSKAIPHFLVQLPQTQN